MTMKKLLVVVLLVFCTGSLLAVTGSAIVTQEQASNVITINIKGSGGNIEAGYISIYLYFQSAGDVTTDLTAGNVNVSQIEGSGGGQFDWGSTFATGPNIETGSWGSGDGLPRTFSKRMYYENAELTGQDDDYWTTGGINAIICTFSAIDPTGYSYVQINGGDGLGDWSGAGHSVSYSNQDNALPVQMGNISAVPQLDSGISIEWRTESETNSAGFHIWKSVGSDDAYTKITTALIPSHGNSTGSNEYSYLDRQVEEGIMYWYKVEEEANDGASQFFGPISVMGINAVPTEFKLSKNFPNPFNPETRFKYQLAEDSEVSISVYSLLGQKVMDLVTKHQEAGYYDFLWDGTDSYGNRVASGIYILHMQAGDFRDMQKMTIIR